MAAGFNRSAETTFLWMIPILVTLHNLEETFWIEEAAVPDALFNFLPALSSLFPPSVPQMAVATTLLTLLVWWVAYSACIRQRATDVLLLHFIAGVLFINAISHILISLISLHYQPGLITALLLNLPYCLWFLKRAVQTGAFHRKQLNTMLWVAIPLIPILSLLAHSLGKGVELLFG
ncbi:hypothetical protein GCM10007416_30580 [Kroppenstedtia guangzhouensis]|uniref:HXXEE domain-containing protein n=1 Tax=Kroppenstedtia guangzhouensis TaxID=1274356 RepID=A0ABQ1H2D6_9BACL|nr:HXXEE domain-containing protein [Kroppenstedtia guangzhouensis]GGA55236.1 hypothetical protein GCM10007416_30580 [Kroppenstedtia guangzhouensis]